MPIHFDTRGESAQAGAFLGWRESPVSAYPAWHTLVSLDVRTGREIWQMPGFPDRKNVVFAGNLALVQPSPGGGEVWEGDPDSVPTLALELRAAKVRWVAPMCRFQADLHVAGPSGQEVGIGLCGTRQAADSSTRNDLYAFMMSGRQSTWTAVAFDLRTGKRRWAHATGLQGGALAADGESVYLAVRSGAGSSGPADLQVLDPRSGTVRRSLNVYEKDPRSLHLVPGSSQALLVGRILSALRLSDGHVLWRKSRPRQERSYDETWPEIHGRRIFQFEASAIREFDALTGVERALHVLPVAHSGDKPPRLLPGPGPDSLLVFFDRKGAPGLAARFAGPGSPPALATLAENTSHLFSARGAALVLYRTGRGKHWMEGYSAFESMPPESAMDGPQRVRAALDRDPWSPELRPKDRRARLRVLKAIPGAEAVLVAFAGDTGEPRQQDALFAATALGVPGLVSLLRSEAARPLRLPDTSILRPPQARPRPAEVRPRRRSPFIHVTPTIPWEEVRASRIRDSLASLLRARGYFLSALAALDDTAAVGLLAPMLLADRSPTGFGRKDWEDWGYYTQTGYGRKSWPAGMRAEDGFSGCLQGPAGRPEVHADVYRMLARLGRPSDRAFLERLDSSLAPAGWAGLCAEDDALPGPFIDRSPWPYGSGMCLGFDAGPYRVAEMGALWLRRRGRSGSWGPPAWAHDPGGDLVLENNRVRRVRTTRDGSLALEGRSLRNLDERSWRTILDPGRIFADADRDGLTDGTEKVLGTDPARADSDGDGLPDGRDPAPKAGPAKTEAGRVADEAVHYLTLFLLGGPVSVYADRKYWAGGGPAGAGLVLHRTRRDDRLPDCPPHDFCADGRTREARDRSRLRCEALLAIDSIQVSGERAEATVSIGRGGYRPAIGRLEMAKVGGIWRVTQAPPASP